MNKYSIILEYTGGENYYYSYVESNTLESAVDKAKEEAVRVNEGFYTVEDFTTIAVLEGFCELLYMIGD